jgi:putative Mg2+ transporter-C (MgtC) family protein
VSRIAAQVVSGIGFIGAGCIIFQKHAVRGLTTAAGLWATAAIGMAAGAGMYAVGVATTIMVIVCLELMNFLHHHVFRNHHKDEYDADED